MHIHSVARTAAVLVVLSLATPHTLLSQAAPPSDSAAIIAVVQRFFDALATRDTAAVRAVLAPGVHMASMRVGAQPGTIRYQSDSAFTVSLATGKQKWLERMWNPIVRVSGNIADLWTPYDFHVDGKFSHCGIDVFSLLRTAAGWQIASGVYTVQMEGCAPSPLGPVSP